MKRKAFFLAGILLGILATLAIGAAYDSDFYSSEEQCGRYQSSFSGLTYKGFGYLAVTDTRTGQTEVFALTDFVKDETQDVLNGRQNSLVIDPSI